jgi:hypothetical protein
MLELAALPATVALGTLFVAAALSGGAPGSDRAEVHRFLVERTFPAGALEGLDAAAKEKVNAANATVDVRWIHSYANADRTKTFCVYEGPSESAVRAAAAKNDLPVDRIVEIPVDLDPGPQPALPAGAAPRRFVVERTFPAGALAGLDDAARRAVNARNAELGVRWIGSYANAEKTRTFCVYEGPSEAAVREAAARSALPIDRIVEAPVDLEPR